MVYTTERLEHALFVFRESEPYRAPRHHDAKHLEEYLQQYNTRTRATKAVVRKPEYWQTSLDGSDGEYNPSKARKKSTGDAAAKPKRPRKQDDDGADSPRGSEKRKRKTGTTLRRGRMEGRSEQITLVITSEKGKGFLKEMAEKYGTRGEEDGDFIGTKSDAPKLFAMTGRLLNAGPLGAVESAKRRQTFEDKYLDEALTLETPACGSGINLRNRKIMTKEVRSERSGCEHCKNEKRRCSLKVASNHPCQSCSTMGRLCIFKENEVKDEGPEKSFWKERSDPVYVKKRQAGQAQSGPLVLDGRGAKHSPIVIETPPTSPVPAAKLHPADPCGRTRVIITNWAHPINFMHHTVSREGEPVKKCHFCDDYRYGIQGCGQVQVEVIRYVGKLEYEEVGNGNRARGHESTRMCLVCALKRIHISNCARHDLKPLGPSRLPDPAKLNYRQWMAQLSDTTPERQMKLSHPPCLFCQSHATFQCETGRNELQVKGLFRSSSKVIKKCSLRLCTGCKSAVSSFGMQKGLLEADIRERRVPVRADMEFLFPGSDLHKAWGVELSNVVVSDQGRLKSFEGRGTES